MIWVGSEVPPPQEVLDAVEKWALKQEDKPPRSPAIRRLVEIGLKVKGK